MSEFEPISKSRGPVLKLKDVQVSLRNGLSRYKFQVKQEGSPVIYHYWRPSFITTVVQLGEQVSQQPHELGE